MISFWYYAIVTDYNPVELCCSQVLDSLLGLLSTSELVGALGSVLANDENEVVLMPS